MKCLAKLKNLIDRGNSLWSVKYNAVSLKLCKCSSMKYANKNMASFDLLYCTVWHLHSPKSLQTVIQLFIGAKELYFRVMH